MIKKREIENITNGRYPFMGRDDRANLSQTRQLLSGGLCACPGPVGTCA